MSRDRLDRIKEILLEVQDLAPEDAAGHVTDRCGDDTALRDEILSLLRSPTMKELRTAAGEDWLREVLGDSELPEWIGSYRIEGVLGRGGMGVVLRARQSEPIERVVALKLAPPGHDSARVVRRFEEERRLLARLEHPGIAMVFDAGSDADGRPFFVMELVDGAPVTEYVRRRSLDRRTTLGLFVSICRAVQHAHQRGILHRDLKPSNILVTEVDGAPVPKIIDFGVAKALQADTEPGTLRTREGQIIGTLEYMSPEQATGRLADIGTPSDIYSVCAVLYEVITGSLPVSLAGGSTPEAVRRILEVEPAPLSTGSTDTGHFGRDLSTVVHKGLEKEPERRYDSMAALAEDLERLIADQPILARPPSTAYLVSKFAARHRALVAFVGVIAILLAGFGLVMSLLFASQRSLRLEAETEARRAERINHFLATVLTSPKPENLGRDVTMREVLDAASPSLPGELEKEVEDWIPIAVTLGEAYASLDAFESGVAVVETALVAAEAQLGQESDELIPLLMSLVTLHYYLGDYAFANAASDRAAGILAGQRDPDPKLLADIRHNQGYLLRRMFRYREAEQAFREAADLRAAELGEGHRLTLVSLNGITRAVLDQGDFARGLEAALRSREAHVRSLVPGDPWLAPGIIVEAQAYVGNWEAADSLASAAVTDFASVLGAESLTYAALQLRRAWVLKEMGRQEEALALAETVHASVSKTAPEGHSLRARTALVLAEVHYEAGYLDRAREVADEVVRIRERARDEYNPALGDALLTRGRILLASGDSTGARVDLERAVRILEGVLPPGHWRVTEAEIHRTAALPLEAERAVEMQTLRSRLETLPAGTRSRAESILDGLSRQKKERSADRM